MKKEMKKLEKTWTAMKKKAQDYVV